MAIHLLVPPVTTHLAPSSPGSHPVDVADLVASEARHHDDGHAWVFANMVTTIDGAATLDGRSGGLGGPGDRELFSALRSEADVILVGAETVRAEGYRLARRPDDAALQRRRDRGQAERARLCIVTRSPVLTGEPPLLDELPDADDPDETAAPWQRPIIATVEHDPGEARDPRFDRIEAGTSSVDLATLLVHLADQGLRRVLCEGGPSLLAQLGAAGLVDEWDFTVAPLVAAGDAVRPLHADAPLGTRLRLARLAMHDDSTLFARYLTERDRP